MNILRLAVFILGLSMQIYLTSGLISGHISYSVGEIDPEERTTATMGEAVALYLAFSPIFIGLILVGINPRLYIDRRWLIMCLLGTAALGYLILSVFY